MKYAAVTFERRLGETIASTGVNVASKGWNSLSEAKDYAARTVDANKKAVEVDVFVLNCSAVVPPPKVDWEEAK